MPDMGRIYEWFPEALTSGDGSCPDNPALECAAFTVSIGNGPQILNAFGAVATHEVVTQLMNRLNQLLAGGGSASVTSQGEIAVQLRRISCQQVEAAPASFQSWLWALCAGLSTFPVLMGEDKIFPILWASWRPRPHSGDSKTPEPADPWHVDEQSAVRAVGEANVANWGQCYRADMKLAAPILAAVSAQPSSTGSDQSRSLMLLWQPVVDARGPSSEPDRLLYHEALVRFKDEAGAWITPSQSLLALERLGLISILDQYIVSRVIDRLEAEPRLRAAVNISARSARCDMWWREIIARLRAAPELARRLTIEITETAELPDLAAAVGFVDGVKKLGCIVALDDFGIGFTSIRQVLALRPDIVKIDGFFMREAGLSASGHALFGHLVQLAHSFGATIVVEGVETAHQAQLALQSGAHWQQGYHWARPAEVISSCAVAAEPVHVFSKAPGLVLRPVTGS